VTHAAPQPHRTAARFAGQIDGRVVSQSASNVSAMGTIALPAAHRVGVRHHPRKPNRGGTILGIIIGLVLGLGLALLIALFLNKSPIPFVNKAANKEAAGKGRDIGDPNAGLNPKADAKKADDKKQSPASEAKADAKIVEKSAEAKADVKAEAKGDAKAEPKTDTKAEPKGNEQGKESYYLQAGAFQSVGDADNRKAQLALLGFEAKVETAEVEGRGTMYRVRIGPYGRLDDINRVRATLAQSGIEGSLVRAKQ
jgi:cell division protein FtsN